MTGRSIGGPERLALVAVGGFAGAILRFAADAVAPGLGGTLAVNVLGSLALGALAHGAVARGRVGPRSRLVLGTGLLSSFTTYSTFAVETVRAPGAWPAANLLATYGLGLAAAAAGAALAARGGARA